MNYQNVSVSLPKEIVDLVELITKRDKKPRSMVVGEAIKLYIDALDIIEKPTPKEVAAIKLGREAHRRGDVMSLDEFLKEVEAHSAKTSRKKSRKSSR